MFVFGEFGADGDARFAEGSFVALEEGGAGAEEAAVAC